MSILLQLKNAAIALQGSLFRTALIQDMSAIETEVNRIGIEMDGLAVAVTELWVSGTNYATGKIIRSPADTRIYKRLAPGGSTTTDPSLDATNWALVPIAASSVSNTPAGNVTATDVQTAINQLDARNSSDSSVVNGEFLVDQANNGAAYTCPGGGAGVAKITYIADMWYVIVTGTGSVTAQVVTGSGEFKNKLQITGGVNVTGCVVGHRIEDVNAARHSGQTLTLSQVVDASALANVTVNSYYPSAAANAWGMNEASPTGTLTQTSQYTGSIPTSATPTKQNVSFTANALVTRGMNIEYVLGAFTSGTFGVTGVDAGPGSLSRPFPHRVKQDVVDQCQWIWERKSYPAGGYPIATGQCTATTAWQNANFSFSPKRISPTITPSSTASFVVINATGTPVALSTLTFAAANNSSGYMFGTVASGLVVGNSAGIQTAAGLASTIDISARF